MSVSHPDGRQLSPRHEEGTHRKARQSTHSVTDGTPRNGGNLTSALEPAGNDVPTDAFISERVSAGSVRCLEVLCGSFRECGSMLNSSCEIPHVGGSDCAAAAGL